MKCALPILCILAVAGAAHADPRDAAPRPLTGPSTRDPLEIGLDYLFGRSATARTARSGGDQFAVGSRRQSPSGVTSIVLRQYRDGIEVWKSSAAVHVDALGRVLRADDRAARRSSAHRALRAAPPLGAVDALLHAFDQLGLEPVAEVQELEAPTGREQKTSLTGGGVARDGVRARLMWLPEQHRRDGGAGDQLVWNLWIEERRGRHAWEVNVDAETGVVRTQHDRIRSDRYRVFDSHLAGPGDGERTLVVDPADPVASPFGWHDTDGVPGADETTTRGNNAIAADDSDGDDDVVGSSASGGVGLDFDFPIASLDAAPESSLDAALTNAFYQVNRLHDVFYRYGFDEASGNFQQSQNGNPALNGLDDPVLIDVQDGWATGDLTLRNNATFLTPVDGLRPRMQLFIWTDFRPRVQVLSSSEIEGSFPAGAAAFGPALNSVGVTGRLVAAIDAIGPESTSLDGCSPFSNAAEVAGGIALVDRGDCTFLQKVTNAEAAGAVGVVIINHESSDLLTMVGDGDPVTIPSLFIGRHNGRLLREQLADAPDVTLFQPVVEAAYDSAFSNGTIAHEFGHGVTNRLTGGGFTTSCLDGNQPNAMGEGWSDFFELVMTARPGDSRETLRTTGPFLWGEIPAGGGIRRFPYTVDRDANPLTYAGLANTVEGVTIREHDGGEIWASALWEMYWNLTDAYGFEPAFHGGYTGEGDGNALALQLVVDGLALQPCEPTFLEARDAILEAEAALTGGANACHLWHAFASRGMGESANDGGSSQATAVTEAFDVPVACPEPALAWLQAAGLGGLAALRRSWRPGRGR